MANIDEMMYSCGVNILHPGGLGKTVAMANDCKVGAHSKVLDIGSGKGFTAMFLAQQYGCDVVGVDLSPNMVAYATRDAEAKGLVHKVSFMNADAQRLPFDDDSFDVVIAECSTVLMDREQAFKEFIRVTKPGGHIGDLEMTWQQAPSKELVDGALALWEGFTTNTFDEWRHFYEKLGLTDVKVDDFSDKMRDLNRLYVQALGFKGIVMMMWYMLTNGALRRGMSEYNRFFADNKDYIGYGYFVGRKSGALKRV